MKYGHSRSPRVPSTLVAFPITSEDVFRRNRFSIGVSQAPANFRSLFIGKPQTALILLFHQLDHVHHIGLAFRRPSQHAIEHFLDLIFCHATILAYRQDRKDPLPAGHSANPHAPATAGMGSRRGSSATAIRITAAAAARMRNSVSKPQRS